MRILTATFLGIATAALIFTTVPSAQAATVTYNLRAALGAVVMPDGASVPVWGLVDADQPGTTPLTPVPVLTAASGDDLVLNLTNQLTEPVSLVINGQPVQDAIAPVFFSDGAGRQRVRSFMHAAVPSGSATYRWGPLNPGTYLITSGSHPAVQVPMGLYAVLKVGATAGSGGPYDPNGFDSEATLLFSEIDPLLNQAVADGIYGDPDGDYPTALKVGYKPKYFLLNGRPWSAVAPPLATVSGGDTVLLRLVNAGLRARVPVVPGQALIQIAEDGYPLNFQPTQTSVDLTAGKTLDAIMVAPVAPGYLAVHDRMLGLTGGGMLGYLTVGTPAVTLSAAITGSGSVSMVSAPGGISCPGDCSEVLVAGTTVTLKGAPADSATVLSGWSVTAGGTPTGECVASGDCVVTLDQDKTVTAVFSSFAATTLISPNGGEAVPLDATMLIRWAAPANLYTFDLGFSPSPGAPFRKIADRVGGREFLWSMATTQLRVTNGARISIIAYDAAGNVGARDSSDAPFALVSPLELTAPNGGESILAASPYNITWNVRTTTPTVVRATLWYQSSSAAPWTLIADVDPATGSYAWTSPATATAGATARIALTLYDAAGKTIATDASDAPFSVVIPGPLALAAQPAPQPLAVAPVAAATPAAMRVLTTSPPLLHLPVAGDGESTVELLYPGEGEVITSAGTLVFWMEEPQAVTYQLDYSIDGGQTWQRIAEGILDTSYDWVIDPALRGGQPVRLRITALDGDMKVLGRDTSEGTFTIE